ncbi:MAG: N-(5'-phosphoribosyl)anthranilate isomerase [Pseudomonadota bacterium]
MTDLFQHARDLEAARGTASPVNADTWLIHVFLAKASASGGVVRRKARDVERIVGWRRFRHELKRRGFSAIRNGGQVVIFCNTEPLERLD